MSRFRLVRSAICGALCLLAVGTASADLINVTGLTAYSQVNHDAPGTQAINSTQNSAGGTVIAAFPETLYSSTTTSTFLTSANSDLFMAAFDQSRGGSISPLGGNNIDIDLTASLIWIGITPSANALFTFFVDFSGSSSVIPLVSYLWDTADLDVFVDEKRILATDTVPSLSATFADTLYAGHTYSWLEQAITRTSILDSGATAHGSTSLSIPASRTQCRAPSGRTGQGDPRDQRQETKASDVIVSLTKVAGKLPKPE